VLGAATSGWPSPDGLLLSRSSKYLADTNRRKGTAGYKNRILRVNLSNRTFSEEALDQTLIHDFAGGRGFGVKMLYDDLKLGTDPLGDWSELIFLAGPLAGTNAQSFSRWKVFFKSPLTGTYFKSAAGGR
jgi:aldehyde:ferredoxin oxidoreductase